MKIRLRRKKISTVECLMEVFQPLIDFYKLFGTKEAFDQVIQKIEEEDIEWLENDIKLLKEALR
jgi:cob(I)alamin adenosyltransferase